MGGELTNIQHPVESLSRTRDSTATHTRSSSVHLPLHHSFNRRNRCKRRNWRGLRPWHIPNYRCGNGSSHSRGARCIRAKTHRQRSQLEGSHDARCCGQGCRIVDTLKSSGRSRCSLRQTRHFGATCRHRRHVAEARKQGTVDQSPDVSRRAGKIDAACAGQADRGGRR